MVRHASLFSQLIALFNRSRFYEVVYLHQAERCAKGFSCWDQFVAMLFCHIGQAKSLREITGGLASAQGKLLHLGVKRVSLTLDKGQTRFVRLNISIGFFVGHVYPELVDQATGEKEIQDCRNTGK